MGTGSITTWACLSLAAMAVAGAAMDLTTGATATIQVHLQDSDEFKHHLWHSEVQGRSAH